MLDNLKKYNIILASQSPRRRELLKGLKVNFSCQSSDIEESFPDDMPKEKVAAYLSEKKANAIKLLENDLIIASDTTVLVDGQILNKPSHEEEAIQMLSLLSNKAHEVITGVCIRTAHRTDSFSVSTKVHFKELSLDEMSFYIRHFQPYDKAGSYGIQEWIGYIGISKIDGCYYNVMGLPLARLYQELLEY